MRQGESSGIAGAGRRRAWEGTRRRSRDDAHGFAHTFQGALVRLWARLAGPEGALPDGRWIPGEGWARRHAWILLMLWVHVPLLFAFALYGGRDPLTGATFASTSVGHAAVEAGAVAFFALLASLPTLPRRSRGIAAAMGLAASSGVLVHLSGGLIEAHFHFLVIVAIISLYQDWLPLGLGIVFVAAHHATVGIIEPGSVYNHPAALAHPVRWAFVHAFFVLGLALVEVIHWRSAHHLRAFTDDVLGSSTEGVIGLDPGGHIILVNRAAERLVGRRDALVDQPASRVLGERIGGLFGDASPPEALAMGTVRVGRGVQMVTPEGATRYVDWTSTPLVEDGHTKGAVITLRDVTERHLAEWRLLEKEVQLSAAQRLAHVGSFEWAPVADVLRVSEELQRVIERGHGGAVPPAECLEDLIARVHPEDQASVREAFHDVHQRGVPIGIECRIGTGPSLRHCELRARLEEDRMADQPVRLVRGSWHDVSERVRAEEMRLRSQEQRREIEMLREQDGFKNRFINAIAHELNTPLTPLRLQLHLMKRDPESRLSDQQRRAVRMMERNVQRFGSLVEDLLDAARIQGGKLRMQRTRVRLDAVVEEAVEHFEGMMLDRDLVLEMEIEADLTIEGDRDRLVQVVYNLLSNACKFTPKGGTITVALRRIDDEAVLKVRDTGIGIEPREQDRLFQPFMQIQDHMETSEPGTGLGLFLSRGLVELHEGRIWCESDGAGCGSTFAVGLPLSRARLSDGPDRRGSSAAREHDIGGSSPEGQPAIVRPRP